jgi:hypothetical protein
LKGVYNIYRLRKFPGGIRWALSDLTYVYHALKGDLHLQVIELHRKYGTSPSTSSDIGDVVQIQPNHISFTCVEAIQDIHGMKAKPVKGDIYNNLFQPPGTKVGANLLTTTYPLQT